MLNSRLSSIVLACIAAGALAGCDTQAEPEAQASAETAADSGGKTFTGTIDRAFAGATIPAVTVTDPSGAQLELQGVGEPVLLNLWATWCAPCVVEMPLLDDLAAELDGEVEVLTVSADLQGAEVVEPFFAERDLPNLPQWLDPQGDLAFAYGGGGVLPLTVLYDAQGREVWRVVGAYDWASEEARAAVREALSGAGA